MKRKLFTALLGFAISCFSGLMAQDGRPHALGVSGSPFGKSAVLPVGGADLEGAPSFTGEGFYALGIHYSRQLKPWLELETGLEYARYRVLMTIGAHPGLHQGISVREEVPLMSVPLIARVHFLRYFFVNGGVLLSTDISLNSPVDSQGGLGGLLGLGARLDLSPGVSVFVNPYQRTHALIPFQGGSSQGRQRLGEFGLRMGLSWQLKTAKGNQ